MSSSTTRTIHSRKDVYKRQAIGRHLYAVGGNEKATKLSGINTKKVYFFAYANMGFLAALAGVLTIARMASAQPTYGDGYEMDAIGACFIGGASAYGGVGTVPGVIVGAVLMGVILSLIHISMLPPVRMHSSMPVARMNTYAF